MKVSTAGHGGATLRKQVTLISNDPKRPQTTLSIQLPVTPAISVVPDRIRFTGTVGDSLMAQVRVSPAPGLPMAITSVHARYGKVIRFTLDPLPGTPPPSYLLTVTWTGTEAGRIEDVITIFTDSPKKPKVSIPISGLIQQR